MQLIALSNDCWWNNSYNNSRHIFNSVVISSFLVLLLEICRCVFLNSVLYLSIFSVIFDFKLVVMFLVSEMCSVDVEILILSSKNNLIENYILVYQKYTIELI